MKGRQTQCQRTLVAATNRPNLSPLLSFLYSIFKVYLLPLFSSRFTVKSELSSAIKGVTVVTLFSVLLISLLATKCSPDVCCWSKGW